jgi:endoglucanase
MDRSPSVDTRTRSPIPTTNQITTNTIHAHTHSASNGYRDELAWAALFLHKATQEARYLEAAESHYPSCCAAPAASSISSISSISSSSGGGGGKRKSPGARQMGSAFTWNDKSPGVQLLLHNATGDPRYADDVALFLNAWRAMARTPGGLAYYSYSPLQYAASASFLALVAAESGIDPGPNRRFAEQQLHYMLGLERSAGPGDASQKDISGSSSSNSSSSMAAAAEPLPASKVWSNITASTAPSSSAHQSFLIGFGEKSPHSPHHRASSCEFQSGNSSCQCSEKPNFFVLFGGLVGGPLPDDSYSDDCQDFESNYVSLVGNAGFVSGVAGLKQLAMRRAS